jgi:hypothetical protein
MMDSVSQVQHPHDQSKVESVHQIASPKRKLKDSHVKKTRVTYRREILSQLSAPLGTSFVR